MSHSSLEWHVASRPPLRRPAEVADWDHIQLSSRPAQLVLAPANKGVSAKPVNVPLNPRIQVDSASAMRELALAGAGLASLPEVTVRAAVARGKLVEVLAGWRLPRVGVYAIWPRNVQRAALTARFLEFMQVRIATLFA
jgi:DNA-binding transcriptional LysR family regulator